MINSCLNMLNNIMIHIINFCNNGYLFKCGPHDFNATIQNVFTEIFASMFDICEYLELMVMNKNRKCMICLKNVDTQQIIICKCCVKSCINYNVDLHFSGKSQTSGNYVCHLSFHPEELFDEIFPNSLEQTIDSFGTYVNVYYDELPHNQQIVYQNINFIFAKCYGRYILCDADIHNFENDFINNLPKLYDKFYHMTLITFIMASNDTNSPIHMLIYDIIINIMLIYLLI